MGQDNMTTLALLSMRRSIRMLRKRVTALENASPHRKPKTDAEKIAAVEAVVEGKGAAVRACGSCGATFGHAILCPDAPPMRTRIEKYRVELRGGERCIVDDDGVFASIFGDDPEPAHDICNYLNNQVNAKARGETPAVCQARQYSDLMRCDRCHLEWDVNDANPPACHKEKGNG